MGFREDGPELRDSMGEAPLAAANCAAAEIIWGAMANMRSRVKREEGPATLMVPMGV